MWINQIFERFVEESPLTVMVRVLLEKALSPEALDELFEKTAQVQYTRELLFSQMVELMCLVTCGIQPERECSLPRAVRVAKCFSNSTLQSTQSN